VELIEILLAANALGELDLRGYRLRYSGGTRRALQPIELTSIGRNERLFF
jgi:hypothetical protein